MEEALIRLTSLVCFGFAYLIEAEGPPEGREGHDASDVSLIEAIGATGESDGDPQ